MGRVFRKHWNFGHIYDKPSDETEISNLKDKLKQVEGLASNKTVALLLER